MVGGPGNPGRYSRRKLPPDRAFFCPVSASRKNIFAHSSACSRSSGLPPENSNRPSWYFRSRHAPKLAISSASRAGPGLVE